MWVYVILCLKLSGMGYGKLNQYIKKVPSLSFLYLVEGIAGYR